MGKALLILVIGFSTLFATATLNMSRHTLESVKTYSNHYENATARNAATSGVYMSLSKFYQAILDPTAHTWPPPDFQRTLNSTDMNVDIQDDTEDANLSSMELRIVSTGTYGDISKNIDVLVGVPPDLADLAVFVTDTVTEVTVKEADGSEDSDSSLLIQNAPEMLPFDKDGVVALAQSQITSGTPHVQPGDFEPPNNWPNGSFYYDGTTTPNVTHVGGNFTVLGGRTVWGIFIVEGQQIILEGNARLEGVLYLPNPGSVVLTGGGDPKESSVTGGIFANGSVDGAGNHISVTYDPTYMAEFGVFQLAKNLFIISWVESPDM